MRETADFFRLALPQVLQKKLGYRMLETSGSPSLAPLGGGVISITVLLLQPNAQKYAKADVSAAVLPYRVGTA
jgi:hypothetical protein